MRIVNVAAVSREWELQQPQFSISGEPAHDHPYDAEDGESLGVSNDALREPSEATRR